MAELVKSCELSVVVFFSPCELAMRMTLVFLLNVTWALEFARTLVFALINAGLFMPGWETHMEAAILTGVEILLEQGDPSKLGGNWGLGTTGPGIWNHISSLSYLEVPGLPDNSPHFHTPVAGVARDSRAGSACAAERRRCPCVSSGGWAP